MGYSKRPPALCGLLLAALATGCQVQSEPVVTERRPSVKMDPCADQLHVLCGRLLLYHSRHRRLPQSLEELAAAQSDSAVSAVCPVSRLPYVYNSRGVLLPGHSGLLIVHDATACHSGMRWGVLVDGAGSRRPFTARVVLLSERVFQSAMVKPEL